MRAPLREALPKIDKPCSMDWDAMGGDARRRHCESCHLVVNNLSAMSSVEREEFIRNAGRAPGQVCIAYEMRRDGTPVLRSRWDWLLAPLRTAGRAALAVAAVCLPMVFSTCATRRALGKFATPSECSGSDSDAKGACVVVPGRMAAPSLERDENAEP